MTIDYDSLSTLLIKSFPTIEKLYLQEKEWYEEQLKLPHVIFGDLLNPFLIDSLKNSSYNSEIVEIFLFLEKLVKGTDLQIKELVQVTVLERLGDDKDILKASYNFMGKETRKLSDEIEVFLGRM